MCFHGDSPHRTVCHSNAGRSVDAFRQALTLSDDLAYLGIIIFFAGQVQRLDLGYMLRRLEYQIPQHAVQRSVRQPVNVSAEKILIVCEAVFDEFQTWHSVTIIRDYMLEVLPQLQPRCNAVLTCGKC